MNQTVEKARRLISVVNLTDVRLLELQAKTSIRTGEISEEMMPVIRHWANVSPASLKDGIFYVRANLDLRIAGEDSPPVVTIRIQCELEYRVPQDAKFGRSELNAFAKVNGIFNAWPYFREIVQTSMQRMSLPPVILPVYRVPQPPRPSTDPTQSTVTGQASA